MISGKDIEMYNSLEKQAIRREIPSIPAMFSALSNVRESLVSHWGVTTYPTRDAMGPKSERFPAFPQAGAPYRKSMSVLARWSSAYEVYSSIRGDNLTDTKRKGTASLRILRELGSIATMFTQTVVDDEKDWDMFYPMFQNIVRLTEDIIELDMKSTEERPPYCINMAIVEPLFKVSIFYHISYRSRLVVGKTNIEQVLSVVFFLGFLSLQRPHHS